jgi:branched-chain amino acid transport system substrate-binding protein
VKKLTASAILVLVASAACACWSPISVRPTLKIGLVAPFEGLYRPLGYEALHSVQLAIEERNELGGVEGYLVELVALNDDQNPGWAPQRAREMTIDPEVMGVIGHLSEETTLAGIQVYQDAGLPLIVPFAGAHSSGGSAHRQVFWLVADDAALGAVAARYAVLQRGALSLAVAGGGETLVETFATTSRALRAEVRVYHSQVGLDLVRELAGSDADLLFLAEDGPLAAETLVGLRQVGVDIPVLGSVGLDTPQLAQIAGEAASGTVYLSYAPPVGETAFAALYRARWEVDPGPRAALAYDASGVLLDALARCIRLYGAPSREGVAEALANTRDYSGLTGSITFDRNGQAMDRDVFLYELVAPQYPGEPVDCPVCFP